MMLVQSAVLVLALLSGEARRAEASKTAFEYDHQSQWSEFGEACSSKNYQSPVRIDSDRAIEVAMPALETEHYRDPIVDPLIMMNNGHTVTVTYKSGTPPDDRRPSVHGARLANRYVFEALHFHWGERNNVGSEHVINDVRYPVELHIVHRNVRYVNVSEALAHADGLVVLGFVFQIREIDNPALAPITNKLVAVHRVDERVELKGDDARLILAHLVLPARDMEHFYAYRGSLTTPPCSEAVTWYVFSAPLPIGIRQMREFRRLHANRRHHLVNNYRRVQPLGERSVYMRHVADEQWQHMVIAPAGGAKTDANADDTTNAPEPMRDETDEGPELFEQRWKWLKA